MTPDSLTQILDGGAAVALAPLLTLTAGVLLLLLAEILPEIQRARPAIFLGTLFCAFWSLVVLRLHPPGLVLDGTFQADGTTAAFGFLFLCATLIAWAFGQRYYRANRTFLGEHDVLMLATPIGMMLMAGAQHLVVFFIGLELLSVPLYCLAAFRRARNDSVEAGLKYFVLGAFAVATFLYGAGLVYTGTGTLSLVELRALAAAGGGLEGALPSAGMALIAASLFFKVSVFPFHLWVPDVYQGSPTPVTTLMATGTKTAGFAVLLNIAGLLPASATLLVGLIAVATIFAGNLGALAQTDLKRMLAYSSVAHAGTILLLVAAAMAGPADPATTPEAFRAEVMQGALFYLAAYVFTVGGAFGLLSWLEADGERFTRIESLRGLATQRPGVAAGLALFMLSLGGIPATGGFLGKYFVFSAAVHAGMVGLALVGILASVIALGYYLRVVVAMYMESAPAGAVPPMTRRLSAGLAAGACAAMVLLLGLLPGPFLDGLF